MSEIPISDRNSQNQKSGQQRDLQNSQRILNSDAVFDTTQMNTCKKRNDGQGQEFFEKPLGAGETGIFKKPREGAKEIFAESDRRRCYGGRKTDHKRHPS